MLYAASDSTGVENGEQYIDELKDNENYVLKPLEQFRPESKKYNAKIKQQLEKILAGKTKEPNIQSIKQNAMSDDYINLFDNPQYDINDSNRNDIEEYSASIFGKKMPLEDLAKMTGALSECKMSFISDYGFNFNNTRYSGLSVEIEHPEFIHYRRIFYKRDGKVCVHNDYFKPKKPNDLPKGIGGMALYKQIQESRKFGIETIDTWAFGNYNIKEDWSGYFVWPELGFNAKIPTYYKDKLLNYNPKTKEERNAINYFKKCKTMQDLFLDKGNRIIWSKFGDSINLEFNIENNSQDYDYLINVLKNKGIIK